MERYLTIKIRKIIYLFTYLFFALLDFHQLKDLNSKVLNIQPNAWIQIPTETACVIKGTSKCNIK